MRFAKNKDLTPCTLAPLNFYPVKPFLVRLTGTEGQRSGFIWGAKISSYRITNGRPGNPWNGSISLTINKRQNP